MTSVFPTAVNVESLGYTKMVRVIDEFVDVLVTLADVLWFPDLYISRKEAVFSVVK